MFLLWNLDEVKHLDAEHLHILDFQIRGLVAFFGPKIYSYDFVIGWMVSVSTNTSPLLAYEKTSLAQSKIKISGPDQVIGGQF